MRASSCVSHFSTSRAHRARPINLRNPHSRLFSYGAEPTTSSFPSAPAAHTLGRHRNVDTTPHIAVHTLAYTFTLCYISLPFPLTLLCDCYRCCYSHFLSHSHHVDNFNAIIRRLKTHNRPTVA